jgi:hypothetical protein
MGDSGPGPGAQSGFMVFAGTSRQCIGVAGAIVAGATLETQTCDGSAAQGFSVTSLGAIVPNVEPNLCLESPLPPGVPSLAGCSGSVSQSWSFADGVLHPLDEDGFCLEVSDGSPDAGAPIDLAACSQGQAQVFWPYGIRLALEATLPVTDASGSSSPLCLGDVAVDGPSPGTSLVLESCEEAAIEGVIGTLGNEMTIYGLCVGVANPNPLGGLDLQSCHGSAGQRWAAAQIDGGTAFVSGLFDGALSECISVAGGQAAIKSHLDLEPCNNGPAQTWRMLLAGR